MLMTLPTPFKNRLRGVQRYLRRRALQARIDRLAFDVDMIDRQIQEDCLQLLRWKKDLQALRQQLVALPR
jgi:hypothetical protein